MTSGADLIDVQDPTDLAKFNMTRFHHLKHNKAVENAAQKKLEAAPGFVLNKGGSSCESSSIIQKLYASEDKWKGEHQKLFQAPHTLKAQSAPQDLAHTAHYSTNEAAASFTSFGLPVRTTNTAASIDTDTVRYSKIKAKGYVQLKTTHGVLNLELRCEKVPRTWYVLSLNLCLPITAIVISLTN